LFLIYLFFVLFSHKDKMDTRAVVGGGGNGGDGDGDIVVVVVVVKLPMN